MTAQPHITDELGVAWILSRHDHGALSPDTYAAIGNRNILYWILARRHSRRLGSVGRAMLRAAERARR